MKNIEKYTNTKDALEAYNKLDIQKVSFDIWLESEYEEPHVQTLLEAAEAVTDEWYDMQQNINCNDIGEIIVDLEKAIAREKKKPVRNCDKYKTAEEAWKVYKKMCDEITCKYCPFSTHRAACFFNWLYSDDGKDEAK